MKYCLLGEKLGHSFSNYLHNLIGLDYVLTEVSKDDFDLFMRENDFDGFNVTIPYKERIIEYLDEIDSKAKSIGAINTVKKVNGKLIGYNTDYYGLKTLLEKNDICLKGKNVVILGSGGACKMSKVLAEDLGAKMIYVISRTGEYNYQNIYQIDANVIINASPVGMYPNCGQCLVELDKFSNLSAVVDMIYNPFVTEIMFRAKENNVKAVNGMEMLVYQGVKSYEIWTGKKVDEKTCQKLIKEINLKYKNVALVGMPSSGKTTIGEELAKNLSKPFIDLDEEIKKQTNLSPEEIILTKGEEEFREIESNVLKEVCKTGGKVISLGGGAVLKEENRKYILQNSTVIYVKRDLEKLSAEKRPISSKVGVQNIYKQRKHVYESIADFEVENNKDIESAIREIELWLKNC